MYYLRQHVREATLAPPKTTTNTCSLTVNVFSGRREPLEAGTSVLYTLFDGTQKQVLRKSRKASSLLVTDLPFFNNFTDSYTVLASADDHRQAGFTPAPVTPQTPGVVDLMLLPDDATFDFREARWDALTQDPLYRRLLTAGTAGAAARNRYLEVLENRPAALACLFNIITALEAIHLPDGSPTDYLRELVWDASLAPDRFFAWADPALVDQVVRAAAQKQFTPETGAAIFHDGATRSFKQVQFGEANVQITFHEKDKLPGSEAVKVELDIDYFRDPAAHALIEVLVNSLTKSLTDPRQVYVLRWMAGRQAGQPNFEPPYRLA